MARKKVRKKVRKKREVAGIAGDGSKPGGVPAKRIFQIALAVIAGVGGWVVWQSMQSEEAFQQLTEAGQSALSRVKTQADFGGGHLSPGQMVKYRDQFPTSGAHAVGAIEPGFYDMPQVPTRLVHSLEHGHVVIYYDAPGAEVLETLKSWASLYVGRWSGVVVARSPGLGDEAVLTAWRKILRLKTFEKAAAAAFIDTFRGRGPENRVR